MIPEKTIFVSSLKSEGRAVSSEGVQVEKGSRVTLYLKTMLFLVKHKLIPR